jgi:polyisoprenoid-binding protein YceI
MLHSLIVIAGLLHSIFTGYQDPVIKTSRADKKTSFISYHMVHPLHEWTGTNKAVEGVIQYDSKTGQINKVAIVVKVSGFDSDNSNRDSHMMEVTEAIKYPNISFVSSALQEKNNQLEVKGTIQFHGVSKEVIFPVKQDQKQNIKTVEGEFDILLEDFKIEKPSLMMVEVDNKVKIAFKMQFILQ